MTHMVVADGYVKQNGSCQGGPWQMPGSYPEENIQQMFSLLSDETLMK
jgi:hypothetical protein